MKTSVETIQTELVRDRSRYADYLTLTKPELSFLSVLTTFAGFYIAEQGGMNYMLLLATVIGTALLAAGAASMNMYVEREYDSQMRRTQNRPTPSGRMRPQEALFFGVTSGLAGAIILAARVNLLTAILGGVTYITYVFVYTPLKRRSTINTLVGCIPGAIPPMMGWTAVRGSVDAGAWALFAILFVWQMPHFLSLAWMYRTDYKRAGFRMTPVEDEKGHMTSLQILLFCAALIPVSILPKMMGMSGSIYLFSAIGLGAAFLALSVALALRRTNLLARRVFAASLLYLPALLTVMMFDKI
ncbi:MAG TPA: heme o synthase [Candidatus Kapabacteria bacterium]|nr:heme o synthase [Candidatus Kapabacteria bacterium]